MTSAALMKNLDASFCILLLKSVSLDPSVQEDFAPVDMTDQEAHKMTLTTKLWMMKVKWMTILAQTSTNL